MSREEARGGFLDGGGEMGALIRATDWAATPLGPVAQWPQSLKTILGVLLNSRYPMFVFWGPELIKIYNDAYRPVTGRKHPWALGRPAREVWPEIWSDIKPLMDRALAGDPTWSDNLLLFLERTGVPEEVYFTFSYSPIPDESGGIGGMFCACTETTAQVLGERRLRTLRDLATKPCDAPAVADACVLSAEALATNRSDVPFSLIYLADAGGDARLMASAGVAEGDPTAPALIGPGEDVVWPVHDVAHTRLPRLFTDLAERLDRVPPGPWPEPPTSAMVLPIVDRGLERGVGAVVLGISARRPFDDDYRAFFELTAGQIGASIASARAVSDHRARAEALAELDRAKSVFFSNASHELRTPLTLMLAPTEDALRGRDPALRGEDLRVVHRNAQRLLGLVNALLDFSRIEAGRVEANREPTDLSALTAELASMFRSAADRAGLRLVVDCPPMDRTVFVDREMWEKVVVNLLSNALKFTPEGEIAVTVRAAGDQAELTVRDTGVGIPEHELPHVFERFHRVATARGRSIEGSGIGLALVHELVRLHGGTVRVASTEGHGSVFTVAVPFGPSRPVAPVELRRPAARSVAAREAAQALVPHEDVALLSEGAPGRARVLVADDNADMRAYLGRLLSPHYDVTLVADGRQALSAIDRAPVDVVVSDVMMPEVDGLSLVARLRADPRTQNVPFILVSARAGEEARLDGIGAGADDYLVKPFSTRELLASVRNRLEVARIRRDADRAARDSEAQLRLALDAAEMGTWAWDISSGRVQLSVKARALFGLGDDDSEDTLDAVIDRTHPDDRDTNRRLLDQGQTRGAYEHEFRVLAGGDAVRWVASRGKLAANGGNAPPRMLGVVYDVTERKRVEGALRRSEQQLQAALDGGQLGAWSWDPATDLITADARVRALFGVDGPPLTSPLTALFDRVHPDDRARVVEALRRAPRADGEFAAHFRVRLPGGGERWVASAGRAQTESEDRAPRVYGVSFDITTRQRGELHRSFRLDLDAMLATLTDAAAIEQVAAARLGAHLEVARCFFMHIAHDRATVVREYRREGAVPLAGEHELARFLSPQAMAQLGQGQSMVVDDVATDARTRQSSASHQELGTGAFITVPVRYADRWVGALSCVSAQPRKWLPDEVQVMADVASRVWPLMEQARAVAALQEANRRKDEFLAMLAHELRNPLAPIRSAAEVLRLVGGADANQRWAREVIERQTQHLTRLVDDLLDVSRITQGKVTLQRDRVDVGTIVQRALETSRPFTDARKHRVTLSLPSTRVYVLGDLTRLVQVVGNLLNNAAKYTDEGGSIAVEAGVTNGEVFITVRDNGMGLHADLIPHVFDLFTQATRSLDRSQGGLGIGLTLVRQLVTLLGGRVEARSEGPGRGSEFTVYLPRLEERADGRSTDSTGGAARASGPHADLRVLIVEDHLDSATTLAFLLRAEGHDVRTAPDGPSGIATAQRFRPDVVLCDLGLPRMNGFEVARRLRAQPETATARLIALSGYGQSEDRSRAIEAGFDHHLTKPVEPQALMALLASLFGEDGHDR